MSFRLSIGKSEGSVMTRQELKAQLAGHVAGQPEPKRVFHRVMKVLEVVGLVLVAAAFAVAMYVSINHTPLAAAVIATAWLALPVSLAPLMILIGVHAIGLRVYFPIVLPGKPQRFVTGTKAVWSGIGLIVTALLVAAFWGALAWAVWSNDLTLIGTYIRVLGTGVGILIAIAIPVAIAGSLFRQIFRSR